MNTGTKNETQTLRSHTLEGVVTFHDAVALDQTDVLDHNQMLRTKRTIFPPPAVLLRTKRSLFPHDDRPVLLVSQTSSTTHRLFEKILPLISKRDFFHLLSFLSWLPLGKVTLVQPCIFWRK